MGAINESGLTQAVFNQKISNQTDNSIDICMLNTRKLLLHRRELAKALYQAENESNMEHIQSAIDMVNTQIKQLILIY